MKQFKTALNKLIKLRSAQELVKQPCVVKILRIIHRNNLTKNILKKNL